MGAQVRDFNFKLDSHFGLFVAMKCVAATLMATASAQFVGETAYVGGVVGGCGMPSCAPVPQPVQVQEVIQNRPVPVTQYRSVSVPNPVPNPVPVPVPNPVPCPVDIPVPNPVIVDVPVPVPVPNPVIRTVEKVVTVPVRGQSRSLSQIQSRHLSLCHRPSHASRS